MLDDYLAELFGSDGGNGMFSGAGGGKSPGGLDPNSLMQLLKGDGGGASQQPPTMPQLGGGGPDGTPYPLSPVGGPGPGPGPGGPPDGGGMDMSARGTPPLMPTGGVPLPQPRPPEAPQPSPVMAPDAMAMLRGPGGIQVPQGMPPQQPDGVRGILGNALGMDIPAPSKRFQSSLAGGLAGGNPNFKGGAFMKGASGGLAGGLASDKEDAALAATRANTAFKNNIATTDLARKQKQTDALTALYGARTESTIKGKTSTAWNKPPNERWKDAQKLIIDKQKQLYGSINPLSPKADRDAQKAQADKDLATFKDQTYGQYGFSPDGKDIAGKPATPSSSKVVGDKEAEDSGLYEKPGKMMGAGKMDDPYMPKTKEDFDALPPGSIFLNPADGRTMTKKAQKQSALESDDADTGADATA